jgi:hypothetical protein
VGSRNDSVGSRIALLDDGGRFRYVGRNNSRGDGDSLLVFIHAVFAPVGGTLSHGRGQFDTVSIKRHAKLPEAEKLGTP